jgi:hypothetical protein
MQHEQSNERVPCSQVLLPHLIERSRQANDGNHPLEVYVAALRFLPFCLSSYSVVCTALHCTATMHAHFCREITSEDTIKALREGGGGAGSKRKKKNAAQPFVDAKIPEEEEDEELYNSTEGGCFSWCVRLGLSCVTLLVFTVLMLTDRLMRSEKHAHRTHPDKHKKGTGRPWRSCGTFCELVG